MRTKKVKAAGRLGVRYGTHVRKKISNIESIQRKKQPCIFCNGTAKRVNAGIWQCKKCDKKFAGHAYYITKEE
jgi:large subunit ribosomal protein L37Ae